MKLASELRARFAEDGVLCVRGAFDADWIAMAKTGIARDIERPGPFFQRLSDEGSQGFFTDMWARLHVPELARCAMEGPSAALAAQCLGIDRVSLVQDVWFLKQSGTTEATPWHHDNVILGPFCSVWVALDPTPREATLEFVRGSHKLEKLFMPKAFFEQSGAETGAAGRFYRDYHGAAGDRGDQELFSEIPDIEADRGSYDIVGWDLEPGDCVVFHARTLHGSPGNGLAHDISRFVTRWVGAAAVLAPHGRPVLDRLSEAGFQADIEVGEPIRGLLFPEVTPPIE